MSIRTILTQDDPALSKVCHPVTKFDGKLADLLDDLKETLSDANGAGLAAPQIGILRRAVIVVPDPELDEMIELVNPELLAQEGEQDGWEGCLSLPGMWGKVKRPNWVRVRAQDRYGNWFEIEGTEMAARCYCHELEHLDGHTPSTLTAFIPPRSWTRSCPRRRKRRTPGGAGGEEDENRFHGDS